MTGNEFKSVLDTYFPERLAYDWDNVGLQVGTLNKEIKGVLISLDLTLDVIREAVDRNCNLILVHHPLIFRPLSDIRTDSYLGRMIERLIKSDITVVVAHTNFDVSNHGMNKMLAEMIGLTKLEIIEMVTEEEGLGISGQLPNALSVDAFVALLKDRFELTNLRLIGPSDGMISTVAIAGGSGSSLIPAVSTLTVDAYVTGDITYHHALDAVNTSLRIFDVGHNVEKHAMARLAVFLKDKGVTVPIHVSTVDTNPYQTK